MWQNTRLLLTEARFGNTKNNYNHSIEINQMQKEMDLTIIMNINQVSRGDFALYIGGRGHSYDVKNWNCVQNIHYSNILNDAIDIYLPILTNVINSTIKQNELPNELELVDVFPVYKKIPS